MKEEAVRVLVVDDSAVARRFVSNAVATSTELEIVGNATNGKEALECLQALAPDIITLDVEMPVMDGIEALEMIRRRNSKIPIIMFSTLTERGARTTLEALSRGANDYVAKPSSLGGNRSAPAEVKLEIVQKLLAHTRYQKVPGTLIEPLVNLSVSESSESSSVVVSKPPVGSGLERVTQLPPIVGEPGQESVRTGRTKSLSNLSTKPSQHLLKSAEELMSQRSAPRSYTTVTRRGQGRFEALGIGVSTGGPNAMAEVFREMGCQIEVPVFVTQHMPPVFTKMFAERLKSVSNMEVFEAQDGQRVQNGEVYVAPGGFHMEVVKKGNERLISLNQNPPENSCRPAVDVMFRSMVKAYGSNILAVVLTGMGYDGLKGSEQIVAAGGEVVVQDEATSAVWGMPGAVAQAGLASAVVPLADVASVILKRLRAG